MSNLEKLIAAKKDREQLEADSFEQYFIGALSILVSERDWERALATAATCLENSKKPVLHG